MRETIDLKNFEASSPNSFSSFIYSLDEALKVTEQVNVTFKLYKSFKDMNPFNIIYMSQHMPPIFFLYLSRSVNFYYIIYYIIR